MTDAQGIRADLLTDPRLGPDLADQVAAAFAAAGVEVQAHARPPVRGADDITWLVLAVLPLQAFLASLGGKVADDVYRQLTNLFAKFGDHAGAKAPSEDGDQQPEQAPAPLVLQDAVTGVQVVLDNDLPADGYQQLLRLDLAPFRFGPVHYDRAASRWRAELDEAWPQADGHREG